MALVALLQLKLVEQCKVLLVVTQDLRDLAAVVATHSWTAAVMVALAELATLEFIKVTHVAKIKFTIIEVRVFKDSYFFIH